MKRFCVIGNPIAHSLSPNIFKYIFKHLKINAEYKTVFIKDNNLLEDFFLKTKNIYNGYNITAPFKDNILDIVDEVDSSAKILKSINCIKNFNNKLVGYNTDYCGFELLLKNLIEIDIKNRNFLILGNGSTARTVAYVLSNLFAKNINIIGRNSVKVDDFLYQINKKIIGTNKVFKYKKNNFNYILINCLPINISKDDLYSILENIIIENIELLIDVNYKENFVSNTFINRGIKTIMGQDMLLYQALKNFDIWFDAEQLNNFNIINLRKQVFKNV